MWQSLKNYLFAPAKSCFLILYFISKWTPKCISFVFFKIPEIPFVRE